MLSDASHDPDDIKIPIHEIQRQHSNESTNDECSVQQKKSKFDDDITTVSNASDELPSFDALENSKVAIAQFAAIALGKGADKNAIKDLSLLQSTLFTLQHQQVVQLQLIQKLQSQIESTNKKGKSKKCLPMKPVDSANELENQKGANVTPPLLPSLPPPPSSMTNAKTTVPVKTVTRAESSQNG